MRFGTFTILMVLRSSGVFVAIHLKKGHLENVPLAGLGCRVCLLSLLGEADGKDRVSCDESPGLSLLPATFPGSPDSPHAAQAILVAPLPPQTASSLYVHCRVGAESLPAPSAAARSDPYPPGSYFGTNHSRCNSEITPSNWLWTGLRSAVNSGFVAMFGFVSSTGTEKTVWFTWAQGKEENWESQSLMGLLLFPDLSLNFAL